MYAVLVVVVVDGMVFIGVVEACRWVVIVVVLGGWIGVWLGIVVVVVVGAGRVKVLGVVRMLVRWLMVGSGWWWCEGAWFVKETSYRRERKHPAAGFYFERSGIMRVAGRGQGPRGAMGEPCMMCGWTGPLSWSRRAGVPVSVSNGPRCPVLTFA